MGAQWRVEAQHFEDAASGCDLGGAVAKPDCPGQAAAKVKHTLSSSRRQGSPTALWGPGLKGQMENKIYGGGWSWEKNQGSPFRALWSPSECRAGTGWSMDSLKQAPDAAGDFGNLTWNEQAFICHGI